MPMSRLKDTLSLNPVVLVLYKDTNQPYIDSTRCSYLFTKKAAALDFCKNNDKCTISEERYYRYDEICSLCYANGALQIKCSLNKEYFTESTSQFRKRKYYNPDLNYTINGLIRTQQKQYLYGLSKCKYIVPIKVTEGTVINYGIARIKDREFFLGFTDLDEYAMWSSKVEGYSAIELTFYELTSLATGKDIIINIMGRRAVLSKDNISKILVQNPPEKIKMEEAVRSREDTDADEEEGEKHV